MDHIDSKFIGLVSARLDKFKQVKSGLYNFRCPMCGDSQKHKNKARGYLYLIKNAYNYPDICHFVKYDDLVKQPEQEFKKIYQFIDEPYYNHRFDNLDQVKVNGLSYDDKIVGRNMHKLFDGPIRKVYNPYIEKIPERIRQKYEHIRF